MVNPIIKMPYPLKDLRYKDATLSKFEDLSEDQSSTLMKWLENPKNFLFIHADFGVGKTYLAAAIANRRYEKNLHTYYFNEYEIFSKLSEVEQEGQSALGYIQDLCGNQFMIWDDFGSTLTHGKNDFKDNEKKNIMFQFIDQRYNSMLPTVITTNYSIEELGDMINPRIRSRLAAKENLIIEIIGDDKRASGL